MLEILRAAARTIEQGRAAALATIVATHGSTPGKLGAKMLVRDDGSTVGTVGGGCTEADIWRIAMEVATTGRAQRATFRLTAATAAQTGLLCGGEFEVFVEPIVTTNVHIFGAGHIARSLAPLLLGLGCRVTVVDDRATFASAEHFPAGVETVVQDLDGAFSGLRLGPHSYVIIVTRGHEHDETVLAQAVRSEAGYIGLIGSRGKIGAIFKNLRAGGTPPSVLAKVHAPIGLDIGAQSPEEIAVSIAAEIIAVRRGVTVPIRFPHAPEGSSG
ncbi:MAG: XdhC family protein [Planctomycetota bacterium]